MRQSCSARAAALDQDALRHQFDFQRAIVDLLFARGGRAGAHGECDDDFLHLLVLGKDLPARGARVAQRIGHDSEIFRAFVAQRHDQRSGKTMRNAKARDGDRGAVLNIGQRGFC